MSKRKTTSQEWIDAGRRQGPGSSAVSHDDGALLLRDVTAGATTSRSLLAAISAPRSTVEEDDFDFVSRRPATAEQRLQQRQLYTALVKNLVQRYPRKALPLYLAGLNTVVGHSMRLADKCSTGDLTDRRADSVGNDATPNTDKSASRPTMDQRRLVADESRSGRHVTGSSSRKDRQARLDHGFIRVQKAPIHPQHNTRLPLR